MPAAEIDIDESLVRLLLRAQCPQWASLSLTRLGEGWDNVMFRLGAELTVRLPRRAVSAHLVAHEHKWLPHLPALPLAVPTPVFTGAPRAEYPWVWGIQRFVAGSPARHGKVAAELAASPLAACLRALHVEAPAGVPRNPYRGVALSERDERSRQSIVAADEQVLLQLWEAARRQPIWSSPPTWVHGDFHPGNLLVNEGVLSGVIDWGDLNAGDPACDLAVAWMMLDTDARATFRRAYGADDALWGRARGWAASLCAVLLSESADNPAMYAIGSFALSELRGELS